MTGVPTVLASRGTALVSLAAIIGIAGEIVSGGMIFAAIAAGGLAVLAALVLAHQAPR